MFIKIDKTIHDKNLFYDFFISSDHELQLYYNIYNGHNHSVGN